MSRKISYTLLMLAVLWTAGVWGLRISSKALKAVRSSNGETATVPTTQGAVTTGPKTAEIKTSTASVFPVRPAAPAAGVTEQRAFRFVLDGGELALESIEEIKGDFRAERGGAAWDEGMLCCRLLDSSRHVLAEKTLPAPDHFCVVLATDPETGQTRPVAFTPPGPVVFQVRLPKVVSAAELRVYRLNGPRPEAEDDEPAGRLLATIPLPR